MAGRHYWLKLSKDFFERYDIKIIERIYGGNKSQIRYSKKESYRGRKVFVM